MKASELLAEVLKTAKERPNVSYLEPSECYYNSGECSDGTVGCIFGQCAAQLGSPIEDEPDNPMTIRGAFDSVEGGEDDLSDEDWRFAKEFQRAQDGGYLWGHCQAIAQEQIERQGSL